MVSVTRLDGSELVINADLILTVESTPDTLLTLVNGDKLCVRESVEAVLERVVFYRRRVGPVVRSSAWSAAGGG